MVPCEERIGRKGKVGDSICCQFVQFSLLWSFLAGGGVVSVAYQGFLVRKACVSVLMGGAGFLLSGVQ